MSAPESQNQTEALDRSGGADVAAIRHDPELVIGSPIDEQRQSVSANFSWMLFGNVITAASNWLIIAVIARLTTPQVVGEYAYALALCQPLIMLSQLNLRSLQATDAEAQKPFYDYFTLRIVCSAACLVVLGGLCVALRLSGPTAAVIMILGASMCFDSISDVIYGLLQQQERMKVIGISSAWKGAASLVGLGAALVLTRDLFWGAVASATASALVLLFYDLRNATTMRGSSGCKYSPERTPSRPRLFVLDSQRLTPLWQLAKSAVPIGMVTMFCSLTTSTPRLALAHFRGTYELGVFAAIMSMIGVGRIVMNALGQAATPRMARHIAAGDVNKFQSVFRTLLLVGSALSLAAPIGAYLIGEEVIVLIYGPAYSGIRAVLTWCMFAGAISYLASFVGYAITASRIFVAQLHLLLGVCVVGVASSWFLVPIAGLTGAAWSFALAMAVQAIGSLFLLRSKLAEISLASKTVGAEC